MSCVTCLSKTHVKTGLGGQRDNSIKVTVLYVLLAGDPGLAETRTDTAGTHRYAGTSATAAEVNDTKQRVNILIIHYF